MSGYREISADLMAWEAEDNSNLRIEYNPFHPDYKAEIGLQAIPGGGIIFAHVWNGSSVFWRELASSDGNVTYNVKMTWDGTSVRFFLNGAQEAIYTPGAGLVQLPFPIDHGVRTKGHLSYLHIWQASPKAAVLGY